MKPADRVSAKTPDGRKRERLVNTTIALCPQTGHQWPGSSTPPADLGLAPQASPPD
jgi:hypothetical protein